MSVYGQSGLVQCKSQVLATCLGQEIDAYSGLVHVVE